MTTFLSVHPQKPQLRLIKQAAKALTNGVIIYPTDTHYALGCLQRNTAAIERIRVLRGLNARHYFTLSCKDLNQVGGYAVMNDNVFRFVKSHTPGPYTFIFQARKKVGKRLLHHPSRRTIAFRVQSHPVARALLDELDEAIITTTLILANDNEPPAYDDMRERLKNTVDVVLDAGAGETSPSTVFDCTENPPRLLREGLGEIKSADIGNDGDEQH